MKNKGYRNALVLGGGGAKGFAHIGAITKLEEESLRPDVICGTSSGALAGAFYSIYKEKIEDFKEIEKTREFNILSKLDLREVNFEEDKQSIFLKTISTIKTKLSMVKMLRDTSLLKPNDVTPIFKNLFGDTLFEQLDIPFYAVAFDLVSGKDVYINSGPLWQGVLASCSIPGIFPPVEYNDMLLVDGGVTNRLPVKCAVLLGAKNILCVDISGSTTLQGLLNSVVDIHLRIDTLTTDRFDMYNSRMADLIVKPNLDDMKWHEFKKHHFAIEKGNYSINELLPLIKKLRSRTYIYKKNVLAFLGKNEKKRLKSIEQDSYIFI